LHALNFGPVDVVKELVGSNLLPFLRSVFRVLLKQPSNEVLTGGGHSERKLDLLMLDGICDFVLVVRIERRKAANHFVKETAQCVEVHGLVMGVS
jgi:hypothetical protein